MERCILLIVLFNDLNAVFLSQNDGANSSLLLSIRCGQSSQVPQFSLCTSNFACRSEVARTSRFKEVVRIRDGAARNRAIAVI